MVTAFAALTALCQSGDIPIQYGIGIGVTFCPLRNKPFWNDSAASAVDSESIPGRVSPKWRLSSVPSPDMMLLFSLLFSL